jgi:hypothetical protein
VIQDLNIRVTPREAADIDALKAVAVKELRLAGQRISGVRIARRSIDARQRRVMVNLLLHVYIDQPLPDGPEYTPPVYKDVHDAPHSAIVVGAGPGGLFAALRLIELGIRPIVLERGKAVDERLRDMAAIARQGVVDPNSNYCFGEGGAGAYSDGKLYTRSKKRGSVDKILQVLHLHGAKDEILYDAHPHIGTDKLPLIIKRLRQRICDAGGEVRFSTLVTDLLLSPDKKQVVGVDTENAGQFHGRVILATGHSARDVYRMLLDRGVKIEPKGIAIGVRLEHPQALIDQIQYHSPEGRGPWLPAAEYSMLTRVDDRAVYSFCMCPGGFIIPAASQPGQLVVNGMSPSNRGTRWANSGMVVEILPDDIPDRTGAGPLKMMALQEDIERKFFLEDGGSQNAPAQRMTDFVAGRPSKSLPRSSYAPGVHPARIDNLLPPFIARRLQRGFEEFGRKSRGFLSDEAILIGCETRTSSPVRITRDPATLAHIDIAGLYPCGEGAGYAGGIVSAAIDGERCADALAATLS